MPEIPETSLSRFLFDVGLPEGDVLQCNDSDYRQAVGDALAVMAPHLREGSTVCIIVDDYTRATPTPEILSYLLPALEEKRIKREDIFFLFASGTHRLMTEEEKRARLSDVVYEQYRSMDHLFFDPAHLVQRGIFSDGAPILINKHALAADIRIAVGTIVPHMPAGYSGGAKMLLPGVAGKDTVHHMHVTGALDPHQAIGVTDTLPRRLMEELAATAEPFVIINTVLNARDEAVGIVGGHYLEAHRRGVAIAEKIYFVEIPAPAEVVISDTREHDADMTQANKGLFSAALAVKEGGEILLVSRCPDGVSPVHGREMLQFGRYTNDEMVRALEKGEIEDPMSAIEVIHNNVVRRKARLYLYSPHITPEEAHQMNFEYVADPVTFAEERLRQGKTVGRLRASTFLVPRVKK